MTVRIQRSVLTPSLAAAKIKPITPHNLRDTAASVANDAGASVVAVARMLGHQDAATTLRHYASLFPDDLDDVAKRTNAKARTARDGRTARPKAASSPTTYRPAAHPVGGVHDRDVL